MRKGLAGEGLTITENDCQKRPAGHFFLYQGELIRPAQDCSESYGCALNFYKVISTEPYKEELIAKIRPEEIHSNLERVAEGIHTYNMNDKYEVLDLKGYETDMFFYVMRPIWFIWRRVKKLLCR